MSTVNPINTDHSSDTNDRNSNSSTATSNHGRTHFLRHFSQQNDTDGSFASSSQSQHQPSSPILLMKKSHRLLRSLTTRNHHSNTNTTTTATTQNIPSVIVRQQGDTAADNISPVSVTSTANPFQLQPPPLSSPNSSSVGKHIKDTKGKIRLHLGRFLLQHHHNEEQITFHSSEDSTRLGICPTCYDVPDSGTGPVDTPLSAATSPSSFAFSASTSSLSNTTIFTIPNVFSGPAIWEEACTLDEFISNNDEKTEKCSSSSKLGRGSPQKSIDSFDDNKSSSLDGSFINYDNVDDGSWKYSSATHGDSTGSRFGSASNKNSEHNAAITISSNNRKNGKNKRNLINKAKSIVQRAREKEQNQSFLCNSSIASATGCGAISSCNSSVVSTTSSRSNKSFIRMTKKKTNAAPTVVDNVKIFLLLVEPKTKVFELIQLLYPRNTTKVVDLLHMIPKHATEPILAQQTYIGITRPKRRSEPIMDVQMFASNNNNTSALPTTLLNAAIESGEIIVALPQHTNTKEIISLSKQILASSHIQQLIVLSTSSNKNVNPGSSTDPTKHHFNQVVTVKDKYHKKKKKRTNSNTSLKCDNTTGSTTTTTTISATLSEDSPTSYSEMTKCSMKIVPESAVASDKELKSPKMVSFVDQISRNIDISSCTERCIQRAMERAHDSNEEVVSPSVTTLLCESISRTQPSVSKSVVSGDVSDSNSHCIAESHDDDEDDDFAFRNMLDAYLSKDMVLKMCSTPNHSKKSSRDVNSSSIGLVDDDECMHNNDTTSCCDDDGSITSSGSSLHSWAHRSLDTSSIPSLSSKATLQRLHQQHVTATDLNSQIAKKPKRFLTKKKMKRSAFIVLLASIIRYHCDPNGIQSIDDQRIRRSQILFEPMGWIGFLCFIFVFATFVKFQKCYRRRATGKSIVGPGETPKTRCPVIKLVAKLMNKFSATIGGKEKSNALNNDSQHRHPNQLLVPSSIHAIHFE